MSLENAIVAIGPEIGVPQGAGFLITPHHVLTCAHVVNSSVGNRLDSQEMPTKKVKLVFIDGAAEGCTASIKDKAHWLPPLPDGKVGKAADMAVLTLDKEAPQGLPKAPLRIYGELSGRNFEATGFPDEWENGQGQSGTVGSLVAGGRHELLRGGDLRLFVRPGFSGAPVIFKSSPTQSGIVIGMVVAAREEQKESTAYMMPTGQLRKIVANLPDVDFDYGIVEDFPHIAFVRKYLSDTVRLWTGKSFDLRISTVNNSDEIAELFRQDPQEEYAKQAVKPSEVLDNQTLSMLLLQSPGGAGKSNFLASLVESAIAKNMVPFFLDGTLPIKNPSELTLADLVDDLTVGGGWSDLEKAGVNRAVVLLDRLNQSPQQAKAQLDAVRKAIRTKKTGLRIIIADRPNERGSDIYPLRRASILPLPIRELRDQLNREPHVSEAKLLAIPFFLAMRIRSSLGSAAILTRAEMFQKFFEVHAKVEDDKKEKRLTLLSEAAFEAYDTYRSTAIPTEEWRRSLEKRQFSAQAIGEIISGAMLEYSHKKTGESVVEFRHQLLHDFLAGNHIAQGNEKFWREPAFEAASLDEQSYDAIELAAEQLGSKGKTDVFLKEVYDWNWGGVLDCVRNLDAGLHGGKSPVSPEFKDALYCLNIVRLFDLFHHTRTRARSITAGIKPSFGADITSATSFIDLRDKVRESYHPKEEYYRRWKDLFLLGTSPATVKDLDRLWIDPFISWTATNVFRKLGISGQIPSILQSFYKAIKYAALAAPEGKGARWRIVHLLGVTNDEASRDFLWSVMVDSSEDKNVRSGAVRSYLEVALITPIRPERQKMLQQLENWLLNSHEKIPTPVLGQIRTIRPADEFVPEGWYADSLQVLQAGVNRAKLKKDLDEEQLWANKVKEIEKLAST
jgi:hypothetical protein